MNWLDARSKRYWLNFADRSNCRLNGPGLKTGEHAGRRYFCADRDLQRRTKRGSLAESFKWAAEKAGLVISSVALAETRALFRSDEACQRAIRALSIRHDPIAEKAALLAGEIFGVYRSQGGPRTAVLPDFLIAAHAALQAGALASADRGYLRRYLPNLRLVTPEAPY